MPTETNNPVTSNQAKGTETQTRFTSIKGSAVAEDRDYTRGPTAGPEHKATGITPGGRRSKR